MTTANRVLITGGTGSLGQGLVRKLLARNTEVVVYSRNEERQYNMSLLLTGKKVRFVIGDVRDTETLKTALRGCNMAIHAAAMKDLIMCEAQPTQCVLNNIMGSISFLRAVKETPGVVRACGVSTDKAASPSNVYGCSKYIMEQIFQEAAQSTECVISSVRFGNMIDSVGSLISTWKQNPGADIKLTHMDVARFFFSVDDGADTVLESLNTAASGETWIRKMKAARIYDILRLITGRQEFPVIGLFPGEKVHEDLLSENEVRFCHDIGRYYVIRPGQPSPRPPRTFSTANAEYFGDDELKSLMKLGKS